MKRLQLSQNSPEWLDYRRLKIGASDCPILMCGTPSQNKSLWKEKNEGISRYSTPAMINGQRSESEALYQFNKLNGTFYEPACFEHGEFEWMMASFDGFDFLSDTHLEIKTPYTEESFQKLAYGEVPQNYMWQLQHQMAISGACSTVLVVYNYRTSEFIVRDVFRDEKKIEQLISKEKSYYFDHLIAFKEPDYSSWCGKNTRSA